MVRAGLKKPRRYSHSLRSGLEEQEEAAKLHNPQLVSVAQQLGANLEPGGHASISSQGTNLVVGPIPVVGCAGDS